MADTAKVSDFKEMDREQLLTFLNARLPGWVALILVALVAWQLARIVWMLIPSTGPGEPIVMPERAAVATANGRANVQAIAEAHLFGAADAEDSVAAQPVISGPNPNDLPDARVSFSLKGTVAASDSQHSVAIIADTNKEEKVYGIGDAVQPGTTIHEIHRDLVVLNQNGVLSKLKLPKEFPKGSALAQTNRVDVTAPDDFGTQSIQSVVAQNVSKLADVIRPTPYFVGGQQQGYRVYPGRDRRQFAALGLRPGDLIKDIDGAALTDPQQAMEIFQNLGNAEEVSVTVERNGQPQVLVLRTSQLEMDDNQ